MQVAAYEGYRTLRFERRGRVLRVTIDRPEMLNAVDDDMHEDLSHVFEEINRDEGCDVVVLTGAGKAFCAGGDARWLQSMIDEPARFLIVSRFEIAVEDAARFDRWTREHHRTVGEVAGVVSQAHLVSLDRPTVRADFGG